MPSVSSSPSGWFFRAGLLTGWENGTKSYKGIFPLCHGLSRTKRSWLLPELKACWRVSHWVEGWVVSGKQRGGGQRLSGRHPPSPSCLDAALGLVGSHFWPLLCRPSLCPFICAKLFSQILRFMGGVGGKWVVS